MFTKQEKKQLIGNYNSSIKDMYTSKGTGIEYFRKKVLKKNNDSNI